MLVDPSSHSFRAYGHSPFRAALLHGGPGAAGEMAPVAEELASRGDIHVGILEPLQTATSVQGQVEELRAILKAHADPPVTLAGYSWGAWLGFLLAAGFPDLVSKLILIGSGPFDERYAASVRETRLERLTTAEQAEFASASRHLAELRDGERDRLVARLGTLASKADSYDPLPDGPPSVDLRADIYQAVWPEAAQLRRSGRLLKQAERIRCPVVAIHGDYDPHPAQGVEAPLSAVLDDFRFVLLQHCGHRPWTERQARAEFLRILGEELAG